MSVTNSCMGERKDRDRCSGCSLVQDFGLEAKVQMLLPKRSNMFSLVSLGLNSDQRRISTSSFIMKNSLRAMRKPGGISEATVTQAEYAALGLATGHEGLASPLPCSARPSSAAPGGQGAEAPAGSPSAKPRAKPIAHCHGRQARG